ncbi:uncharacterized protein K489DRAFT_171935 [Dissoconium aciculare CBS 342.82]|uniref:Uncharacterized protein n=1 Tax=Dissoconium aciculare CBS 342.82 TaxID=1314786 RepID=A0A6J3M8W6_9PEZI|nr:uncharacterized protein K489DRAFT_171935 [Dissoconium aciculare CBS 342.82]KAF1824039.1 hypothetical protein K489DRAFT_171935 [Dissoconium aciculare CBS 342.82]
MEDSVEERGRLRSQREKKGRKGRKEERQSLVHPRRDAASRLSREKRLPERGKCKWSSHNNNGEHGRRTASTMRKCGMHEVMSHIGSHTSRELSETVHAVLAGPTVSRAKPQGAFPRALAHTCSPFVCFRSVRWNPASFPDSFSPAMRLLCCEHILVAARPADLMWRDRGAERGLNRLQTSRIILRNVNIGGYSTLASPSSAGGETMPW